MFQIEIQSIEHKNSLNILKIWQQVVIFTTFCKKAAFEEQ